MASLQDLQALQEELLNKIGEKDMEIDKLRKEADDSRIKLAAAAKIAWEAKEGVEKIGKGGDDDE